MKIASWSGPRNIATALMYAFAARDDTVVQDEPFYASYLTMKGVEHPVRLRIVGGQESDPCRVIAGFDRGAPHLYLKLMAQHMVDGIDLDWAEDFTHLHLVRHPARVIASYSATRRFPTLEDLGYPRQLEIFERFGGDVVLTSDIRAQPEKMLRQICGRMGLEFTLRMLRCPSSGHAADGVRVAYSHEGIHASRTFLGVEGGVPDLEGEDAHLCADAMAYYEALCAHRLAPE